MQKAPERFGLPGLGGKFFWRGLVGDGDGDYDVGVAAEFDVEVSGTGFAAFDADAGGALAGGYDDFRHDDAVWNVSGDGDGEAAWRGFRRNREGEHAALALAKVEASGGDADAGGVDAEAAGGEFAVEAEYGDVVVAAFWERGNVEGERGGAFRLGDGGSAADEYLVVAGEAASEYGYAGADWGSVDFELYGVAVFYVDCFDLGRNLLGDDRGGGLSLVANEKVVGGFFAAGGHGVVVLVERVAARNAGHGVSLAVDDDLGSDRAVHDRVVLHGHLRGDGVGAGRVGLHRRRSEVDEFDIATC